MVEAIKAAKTGIKKNTPQFAADAVIINDEDWDAITSMKDSDGRYMIGDLFAVTGDAPMLWGLKVVPSQTVASGTFIVGAFKAGASVVRNGGRAVDIVNTDGNDFSNGVVAIRPSERIALAVYYPAAFVKITEATA